MKPIALLPNTTERTCLIAPVVLERKEKNNADIGCCCGNRDFGSASRHGEVRRQEVSLVVGLAKALGHTILHMLCCFHVQHRRLRCEDMVSEPLLIVTNIFSESGWSVLLLKIALQEVMSRSVSRRHGMARTKRLSRAGPRSSPCTCRTRAIRSGGTS